MSWNEVSLGDAIHIKHGYAFKSQYFSDYGEYIVLTPGNFYESGGFRLRPGKDRAYTGDIPDGFILCEGDLIIAMTEQAEGLLGSSALVPEGDRFLHNQRLGLIDYVDPKVVNKHFLYYLFNTRSVRHQICGSASGTKVRHTAPERIYRVRVRIPDIAIQEKIGKILGRYDAYIANIGRRIQLLEQAAHLLYKEWFVHLRFPGHEHIKVTNGVPEKWSKTSFSEVADFINGFAFKPSHQGVSGLPIVKIPELREGPSAKTPRNSGDTIPEKCRIDTGDILFSWSGTLLVNIWNHGPALLNQHLFKVVPVCPKQRCLLYFGLKEALDQFHNETTGATLRHIRKSALDNVMMLKPPERLQQQFEDTAEAILAQIKNLQIQSTKSTEARDILLPRLMNGDIPT